MFEPGDRVCFQDETQWKTGIVLNLADKDEYVDILKDEGGYITLVANLETIKFKKDKLEVIKEFKL